jgi:di/tricarboxylate transporter
VGVPGVVVGVLYMILLSGRLLPDRMELLGDLSSSAREYLVNMRVAANSPLVGQRVKQAGLRHLPGLFLIEITRHDRIIAPVTPSQAIEAGDRLTFTGQRSSIVDLERFPGLEREDPHAAEPARAQTPERYYAEAVVSSTSPLIGKNIRDANFRALYNAVVVAVHRGGSHLSGRVGDIVLNAGDTLLLQTGPNFLQAHANNPDFYLISGVDEGRPVRREWAGIALVILISLVAAMVLRSFPIVVAAFAAAAAMVLLGCISAGQARRAVSWDVLLTLAAAIALGEALRASGAAQAIGGVLIDLTVDLGPIATLAAVYLITVLFTEMMTNGAAAVLVFPLAMTVANELGLNPRAFAMAVVFGASFGFATPIGYQTNLMVYGPGGYRFSDYLKLGVPLNLLLWGLSVLLIPLIWPL